MPGYVGGSVFESGHLTKAKTARMGLCPRWNLQNGKI